MKRVFLFLTSLMLANAVSAELNVYAYAIDSILTEDTSIEVTDFHQNFITGKMQAEVQLRAYSDESTHLTVTIQRSDTTYTDEFCAGSLCRPSNREYTQVIDYDVTNMQEREIQIHYNPIAEGKETISYTISDGVNPEIKVSVDFVYQATALEQMEVHPTVKGIYTILGQRVVATSIDELPKGIYIVNGKKVVKQ